MKTSIEIKSAIKDIIKEILPDAEVILFGSRARGNYEKESDWDVLILTNAFENIPYSLEKTISEKLLDLELETGISISNFVYNRNYWESRGKASSLYVSVSKEGVVL